MPVNRTSKMLAYVNYRMRVTILDGRQIVGRFMAFDRHMNLVLSDAEEFRKLPPKKGLSEEDRQTRRVLGFLLLRGEEVVSLTVEGPPAERRGAGAAGARGAGRRAPRGARHARGRTRARTAGTRRRRRRTLGGEHAPAVLRGAHGEAPAGIRPGDAPARVQAGDAPAGHAPARVQAGDAPAGHAPAGVQAGPAGTPAIVRSQPRGGTPGRGNANARRGTSDRTAAGSFRATRVVVQTRRRRRGRRE
jgi:small nuclear ribonucleoprotein B and B'